MLELNITSREHAVTCDHYSPLIVIGSSVQSGDANSHSLCNRSIFTDAIRLPFLGTSDLVYTISV